jgi:putative membrane protein insertion efficiency factor
VRPTVSENQQPSASARLTGAFRFPLAIPAFAARGLIKIDRYTLSSNVGRTCRHLPTCSEYADIAIGRFGLWRGAWMALARFWRCRPLGTHGFDPVPEVFPENARWFLPWRYWQWWTIKIGPS